MRALIMEWFKRYFSNPEVIVLLLSLGFSALVLLVMGKWLMPVLVSIVIAYLLQSLVLRLERLKCPHRLAVILVFSGFLTLVIVSVLGLLPLLWHQLSNLFAESPRMLDRGQVWLSNLNRQYPDYISLEQIQNLLGLFKADFTRIGQVILTTVLASIPGMIVLVIYLILVPILSYFFLMDRSPILDWLKHYLPQRRNLLVKVWDEVHEQIGNYIRGKVIEIIIVGLVCYVVFLLMGMPYAALLSALVGLSVIVPYIGAVIVTIPVVVIAFLQWGLSPQFSYLLIAYAVIVALDANVLVPILFSNAVSLHPVAIIVAVLFFGGIWGFWGVFFAIPLASLVKAVLSVWTVPGQQTLACHQQ